MNDVTDMRSNAAAATPEVAAQLGELRAALAEKAERIAALEEQNRRYVHHLGRINASPWWRAGLLIGRLGEKVGALVAAKPAEVEAASPVRDHFLVLPLGYAVETPKPAPRLAVLLHAYNVELIVEFYQALQNIAFPFALFVSTDTEEKRALIARVFGDWPRGPVEIEVFPNRGRDVGPKFVGFRRVHDAYDYVLHLHTKQSPYGGAFGPWRAFLLRCLIGSPRTVDEVFEIFARCPQVGIVAPRNFYAAVCNSMIWGVNFETARRLAARMGIKIAPDSPIDFPAGSMFWARSAALRPLLDIGLTFEDFDAEAGQTDGTLGHAVERLIFYSAEKAGYSWIHVGPYDELSPLEAAVRIDSAEDCAADIARMTRRLLP